MLRIQESDPRSLLHPTPLTALLQGKHHNRRNMVRQLRVLPFTSFSPWLWEVMGSIHAVLYPHPNAPDMKVERYTYRGQLLSSISLLSLFCNILCIFFIPLFRAFSFYSSTLANPSLHSLLISFSFYLGICPPTRPLINLPNSLVSISTDILNLNLVPQVTI